MPNVGLIELVVVVLVFLMFAAIPILIIRSLRANRSQQRDPALDALRTRFAAGEIDEAEYERLRSVLRRF
jgi:uncharacterized membrane protein